MRIVLTAAALLVSACGTATSLPTHAGVDDVEAASDVEGVHVAAFSSLPFPAPPADSQLVLGDIAAHGSEVLIGTFVVGCGIGMETGPFSATVEKSSFAATLPKENLDWMVVGAFVDVDGDGAFNRDVDAVFVGGGYDALEKNVDGSVTLPRLDPADESNWMIDVIPGILLEATATTVE